MSDGAASDSSRDEAWQQSRGCPHCSGAGLCAVFDPRFDGSRTVECEVLVRGEIVVKTIQGIIWAHCICPIGRWMRSKTDVKLLRRIPDLVDVLSGRSRWQVQDPTRDPAWHEMGVKGGRS